MRMVGMLTWMPSGHTGGCKHHYSVSSDRGTMRRGSLQRCTGGSHVINDEQRSSRQRVRHRVAQLGDRQPVGSQRKGRSVGLAQMTQSPVVGACEQRLARHS